MTGVLLRTGDEDSDMPVHRGEITWGHSKEMGTYKPRRERPRKTSNLQILSSWTCSLQNGEKTSFCCWRHSACGILLWQPGVTHVSRCLEILYDNLYFSIHLVCEVFCMAAEEAEQVRWGQPSEILSTPKQRSPNTVPSLEQLRLDMRLRLFWRMDELSVCVCVCVCVFGLVIKYIAVDST